MLRRVSGRSMLPTLGDGQLVFFLPIKPRVGDIVVANTGKRDVIKRVTSINQDTFLLTSDNKVEGATYTVPGRDILGKVIWPFKK